MGLAEAKRTLIETLRYKRAINHILKSSFIIVNITKISYFRKDEKKVQLEIIILQ